MTQVDSTELGNAIEMALCHISELIGMAHEIACDMPACMNRGDAVLHISGRLATLMHSAAREVEAAEQTLKALANAHRDSIK